MNNATQIIDMLVGLIYDLYPDEEYEELYGIKEKIALAQAYVDREIEQANLLNELEHNK